MLKLQSPFRPISTALNFRFSAAYCVFATKSDNIWLIRLKEGNFSWPSQSDENEGCLSLTLKVITRQSNARSGVYYVQSVLCPLFSTVSDPIVYRLQSFKPYQSLQFTKFVFFPFFMNGLDIFLWFIQGVCTFCVL